MMTNNLIHIGQLLSKESNMKLKENITKVHNGERKMVLKAPLEDNKTFKVEINTINHQCLALTDVEDKNCLWQHMYGHLNFISLGMLNQKKMVYDLPQVKEPSQVCEEC